MEKTPSGRVLESWRRHASMAPYSNWFLYRRRLTTAARSVAEELMKDLWGAGRSTSERGDT